MEHGLGAIQSPPMLPYESGSFQGLPRFACPYCSFSGVRGSEQSAEHVEKAHPTKWLEE
jgi:hypothetical protein